MKEDILEQLVDEYLQFKGYFTNHNIKFRPNKNHPEFDSKQDSNHSDIDVIGFNPLLRGPAKVMAVSCKSWQSGLNPASKITEINENKIISGREAWRGFRELVKPKWSEAFKETIENITGEAEFTHVTAVTHVKGDAKTWETNAQFISAMGNPIKLLTFSEILEQIYPELTTTMASSEVGRVLQLIKASGWTIPNESKSDNKAL